MSECHFGDCREVMRRLIGEGLRVQTAVTSPPYWGLRDYKVSGQLGLEKSLAEYIENMVVVFDLVRELLADDGTLWLNVGDCYATSGGAGWQGKTVERAGRRLTQENLKGNSAAGAGVKPKDLVGVPWELALALRRNGWWLRQDVIWAKPNPMPESVRDRFTKSHEYLFLLSKSENYYFDQDAIKEPVAFDTPERYQRAHAGYAPPGQDEHEGALAPRQNARNPLPAGWDTGPGGHRQLEGRYKSSGNKERKPASARGVPVDTAGKSAGAVAGSVPWLGTHRNKRDVWTIATTPYEDAHFATFPEALVEPCIMAGSRPGDVVFDPFFGSGTVGAVAQRLGRKWVGIELQVDYQRLQRDRCRQLGLELA